VTPPQRKKAIADLTSNANELAKFLAGANPNLPEATLKSLLAAHGGHHVAQNQQLAAHDMAAEAKTWDAMKTHIYTIADALAGAIAKQFPGQVLVSETLQQLPHWRQPTSSPQPATTRRLRAWPRKAIRDAFARIMRRYNQRLYRLAGERHGRCERSGRRAARKLRAGVLRIRDVHRRGQPGRLARPHRAQRSDRPPARA
jgi:hypothetical protein